MALAAFKKVCKKARGKTTKSKSNTKDPVADAPLYVKLIVQWVRSRALIKVGLTENDLKGALASGKPGVFKLPGAFKAEVTAGNGFQGHAKWFKKHMSSQTPPLTASGSFFRGPIAKKMTAYVRKYLPDEVLIKDICGEHSQLNKVLFDLQQFHVTDQHHLVSPVPFAVPECRYLVEGSYNILGWPVNVVQGETLEEKMNAIRSDETAKQYHDMACAGEQGSFYFVHAEPGTVVLIPSGCIACICGAWGIEKENQGGALGLRWGCLPHDDAQLDKVKALLTATEESYGRVSDDFTTWSGIMGDLDAAKQQNLQKE